MKTTRLIPVLILIVLLPVLAGCSRTAQTASRQPAQTPSEDARQVDVELGEWFVRIDPNPVQAGAIQFNIRNLGERLHSFAIDQKGNSQASKNLKPGESTTMTVRLSAGRYHTDCPIGNHEERGMETTLVVE